MRVAVVTGGGTGIGAAIVRVFAARGVSSVVVGRRLEKLEEVAASVAREGGTTLAVPADVGDPSTHAHIVERTLEAFGRLDILVNNAAIMTNRPFEDVSPDLFNDHVAVNLRGPYFLTQAALHALRRSSSAAVVNISSAAASLYRPGQSLYGTTKAALEYLTKSLAIELASERIRVNAIVPGPVDTPILGNSTQPIEETHAALTRVVPLGRIGNAEEIAWWVAQLTQPEAEWVTGAIIRVDGGRILAPPDAPPMSARPRTDADSFGADAEREG